MATQDSAAPSTAPWENKRNPSGKNLIRRSIPWLGGLVLVALIAWGLWPKPVVIETGLVARGPLTVRVSEEGKTRVRNRYIVAAPVAGKMRRVPLKPGDEVKAGETLLTAIEPAVTPLLDPRSRAQAEAVVSMREASRKQATESLAARKAALEMSEADRDRMRAVTQAGSLSDSERDRMEADFSMKSAELRAAEFSLQVIDYELAQARAALARPEADTTGNLVEVKSPVSGRVLKVMQESEMIIAPGTQILEIGDPADIEIEAEILSRDAVSIKPGDSVEVEQWGGETPLKGRVRRVEPAAFTKISALGVEEQRVIVLSDLVEIPEAAKGLGDRYRVEVRVAIWHGDDVVVVPAGALFREGNAWKTYLFKDNTAKLTPVEAGHSDGRFTEILSGVAAGDELLLHPPDTVKDGTPVVKRAE
ncbi:HlyD family efflux transporter periplasmic adaptor subunit [Luteolibacter yonseiensis]|uniref:HlyD family efflux transporter periplasmic adaptor subunit n=1 Tax=Luteolibacter yonseiensis TaxID=1144680 RepID=A0A934V9S8_9BACT|nr:HlyD family efflux transporter periplasmic adaptor subunit [Luteolibacter yonseiensis]MBK1815468.1 HlyD family efflux transporter periplasmic adaptor subunit [Luteolibacter yonseiensis]